jgi:hypothetical protein
MRMRWKRSIIGAVVAALLGSVSPSAAEDAAAQREDSKQQMVPSAPQPSGKLVLKEGTEVSLKLAQKLTAKSAVVGEPVELVLAQDLKVNDTVVVRQGTRVLGTVVAGKESEKKKTEAKGLAMRVDFLRAGDTKIKLRGEKNAEGKRNKDAMVAGTIFLGVSGLLMTSGKHYVIPEGSAVTAYVDQDVELPAVPQHSP